MSAKLSISTEWHQLSGETPEENATFCSLGIQVGDTWLTEGLDRLANSIRKSPHLSAYPLAEWLAWNWWRLRWEPRNDRRPDWHRAHTLTSIGGGYLWPNLTIVTDEARCLLESRQTKGLPVSPYRYLNEGSFIVPASSFEGEVDRFVDSVIERLEDQGLDETNLHTVWRDVLAEREDPVRAWRRKLEALLGVEPDEGVEEVLERMTADRKALGQAGVEELAADAASPEGVPTAAALEEWADTDGAEQNLADIIDAKPQNLGCGVAWQVGRDLAAVVREKIGNHDSPLSDNSLADCAGLQKSVLHSRKTAQAPFTFALLKGSSRRVVINKSGSESRRFAIARILGDELAYKEYFHPSTQRVKTYRQQFQRSFAAELLCPFEALEDRLANDYSDDAQEEAAIHFQVSPLTVRTLLVNHRRISRDTLEGDVDAMAA